MFQIIIIKVHTLAQMMPSTAILTCLISQTTTREMNCMRFCGNNKCLHNFIFYTKHIIYFNSVRLHSYI